MKAAVALINNLSDAQIQKLDTQETIEVTLAGEKAILEPSDVLIQSKDIDGWLVANGNGLTVALDIQLNESLVYEGIGREMINRIQT